jgi:hypothetical protein
METSLTQTHTTTKTSKEGAQVEPEKKVEKKILKEEHLDYLIQLWLKYHNETAVEIKKTYIA